MSKHRDVLPGGLADKKQPKDFNRNQIRKGVSVELEHTNDKAVATDIAMDHLEEDGNYYRKLEKMEKKASYAALFDELEKISSAWQRAEGKNPEGGLNAKGRASLRAEGRDIKPPVSAERAKKSPKDAARRKSFCARMSGMPGPMKKDNGEPTRKALSLQKWDC